MRKASARGTLLFYNDVVTTSAMVNELARAFEKAGVQRADIWTIARVG
jgi:predicted amidophosphoribosyltransferase